MASVGNRKNITEQPSPQANSRYPGGRKKPGDERDSSKQAWKRGWPGTTGSEADSGVEMKRLPRNAKHTLNRRI